jgi:hypothetical protein
MTGTIAGAGVGALARVRLSAITTGGEPARVWTQHCVPQPAAQGQPASWLAGGGEPSTDSAAVQRLESNALPAATDNGNSKACKATT